jgi:hypothetical protein
VMLPHQDAIFIVHHHSLVFSRGRLHPNTLNSTRFSTRKLQDHAELWEKSLQMELKQLLSETTVQAVGISCWNPLASEMHQSPKSGSAHLASKESHSEYSLENLWLDITFVLPLPVSQRLCWPISQRLGIHLETWASTRGMSLNSGCLLCWISLHYPAKQVLVKIN